MDRSRYLTLLILLGMLTALAPFPDSADAASSLMGFLQLCASAAIGMLAGRFDDGTQMPMVTVIGITGLGPLAAYWLVPRRAGT